MILMLAGLLGGGAWGAYLAKKRGGNWKDMAQYAAGYGIATGIVMLFLGVILASFVGPG